jgi:hypothetical protein
MHLLRGIRMGKESRLVYEIMQEVGKHGYIVRTDAGAKYTKDGRRSSGLPKGFSDIMFIRPGGQACFIEAKVKPNKATPEQSAFIDKMISNGCRAGVAYSVEEAMKICGLEMIG